MPEIKFLTHKDIPAIIEINNALQWSWPDEIIKQDLSVNSNNEITYIGAFATTTEAPLLGYAVIGRENRLSVLMALLVSLHYRRKGIASQLLAAAGECAFELGFRRLKLRVRKSNYPAIELYKSMNFKRSGLEKNYYADGEDAMIMNAELPFKF